MFLPNPWVTFFQVEIPYQQYAVFYVPYEYQEENCPNVNSIPKEKPRTPSQMAISIDQMRKGLEKKHEKSKSKLWTEEQDKLLFKLVSNDHSWEEIAKRFFQKSPGVCKRRYERLTKQSLRWPKQTEALIKHLYEDQQLQWKQIQRFLPMYTQKQIKERYKNFLEVTPIRAKWTIEEDLRLWQLINTYGKKWVQFTKFFKGRTQLQLKNRYNKLIKPTQDRLISRSSKEIYQQSRKQK